MPPRIATSNLDLRARLASEPVSPCYGELSPCYGEIISLLPSCSAGAANFPQAIVIKMNFPAKTGPETANSPCFPPVIREYQGESGRQAPLQPGLDPAEFASQQARMGPRRLEMCECSSPRGAGEDNAVGQFLTREAGRLSAPCAIKGRQLNSCAATRSGASRGA